MPIQSIGSQCFACTRTSTVIPSTDTSCSHPDAFVMLSGTSAVLCNVLTPSREVWRAKFTPFLLHHPLCSEFILACCDLTSCDFFLPCCDFFLAVIACCDFFLACCDLLIACSDVLACCVLDFGTHKPDCIYT